jgi:hypothetical protein
MRGDVFDPPDAKSSIESGNEDAPLSPTSDKRSLVLASYNIRYAVGRYLILSGLLRKVGYNFPRQRADANQTAISRSLRELSAIIGSCRRQTF